MDGREAKPDWADLPIALREKIRALLGQPISGAKTVLGGYGPSATLILRTASGKRFFCKGSHPGQTDIGRAALLRERENLESFPELSKFAPAFIGAADHGDWNVIVLECFERVRSVPPWDTASFHAIMTTLAEFHRATPAQAKERLRSAAGDTLFDLLKHEQGWSTLRESAAAREQFVALFEDAPEARLWIDTHIDTLSSLEAQACCIKESLSWIHQDIRSDNLIYGAGGAPKIVDWPYLAYGPTLVDVAFFLPSVAGEGGPAPAEGLKAYQRMSGLHFDADEIVTAAATVAGFFAARAGEPDLPSLPRLRWIQRLQLFPALAWTCDLLKIAPPPRRL